MSRLIDIEIGTDVTIASLDGKPAYAVKLNRYGLFPGDQARVVRHAPFGGPVLLQVRGMEIALGREVARHILVEISACVSR